MLALSNVETHYGEMGPEKNSLHVNFVDGSEGCSTSTKSRI